MSDIKRKPTNPLPDLDPVVIFSAMIIKNSSVAYQPAT